MQFKNSNHTLSNKKDEGWGSFVLCLSDDISATFGEEYELYAMSPSLLIFEGGITNINY